MLNIYPDTKIFVHCPAGIVTGGAELLHQLVSFLRNNERDAYIVYFGEAKHDVPLDYNIYNIKQTEIIDDNNHNIEVFYEGIFNTIMQNKNTQKFLWWLSVENFYLSAENYLSLSDIYRWNLSMGLNQTFKRIKLFLRHPKKAFQNYLKINELVNLNIPCGFQAEFIQNHLHKLGFYEIYPLKDYINTEHYSTFTTEGRKDIVIYNPKKGMDYTKKLIERTKDIQWIPLQGMSRKELINIMRSAKLYVDFGYHPGKDRLPRECALNGCCIITGMRGTASYFEDVPIPNKYKFNEKNTDIEKITGLIRWTLNNYILANKDFTYYRHIIMQEKDEFEQQIRNLFKIKAQNLPI